MNHLYLISISRKSRELGKKSCYLLHFRGFFLGKKVESVRLIGESGSLPLNEEVIVFIKVIKVERNVLYGEVIRANRLINSFV